ncbi:MAG TPA: hypothetical protein VLD18_09590, partial [Verrucomicrobiae bacterium]|nr:hypothetical protein [Verrucomicrobiae bacterium]
MPGLIAAVFLNPDGRSVTLVTPVQEQDTTYTLNVVGVEDVAGNPIPDPGQDITFQSFFLAPGCFFANFNDGVLPAGTAVFGTAIVDTTGGVNDSGVIKVATAAGSQAGAFTIYDLQNGTPVTGFDAQFKLLIGGPAATYERIADGFSFNFGNDLPDDIIPGAAEDGAGNGLRVTFDTWDSGGTDTAPAIEVVYNNQVLAVQNLAGIRADTRPRTGPIIDDPATGQPMNMITGRLPGQFTDVRIRLNNDLTLDLWFKDVQIFTGVSVPYVPVSGGKFVFAARTGGAWADHFIDDVYVCTTTEAPDVNFVIAAQPQSLLFAQGCENEPPKPRFISNFDNGAPAGTTTYGAAAVADGFLHITDAVNGQTNSFIIDDFSGGAEVESFVATFTASLRGSTCCTDGPNPRPADGFSFNFGTLPDGAFGAGEEGTGDGLVVSFDLWDNDANDSAPAISIKRNGTEIAARLMGEPNPSGGPANVLPVLIDPATGEPLKLTTGDVFVPVEIVLHKGGFMDVSYKGVQVLRSIDTGFAPRTGRFGFGAR